MGNFETYYSPVNVVFGGKTYENQDTTSVDTARRFETSAKKLRDVLIRVSTYAQYFGDSSNQRMEVGAGTPRAGKAGVGGGKTKAMAVEEAGRGQDLANRGFATEETKRGDSMV